MSLRTRIVDRRVSSPNTRMVPAAGFSRVVTTRMTVVLPATLGPSSPNTSPSATSKLRSSTARTGPNWQTRPRAATAGCPVMGGLLR